jgi:hypothetical protein
LKIGAENKTQVRWMIALVSLAVVVGIYNFWDMGSTSSAAPPATTTVAPTPKKTGTQQVADNKLDPRLRLDILAASQQVKYEAGGRNIFRMEELRAETPIASVKAPLMPMGPEPPPTPTPTPPPPPIDLKFYGFANKPNEPRRVFLQQNQDNFIAKQGDIVKSRYKVVQISNTSVTIEDVLYNSRQTIPLTPTK